MTFPPSPEIPDEVLESNGWSEVEDLRGVLNRNLLGIVDLRAYHRTTVYADESMRRELSENTLGRVDRHFVGFFANRTRVEPHVDNLLRGVSGGQVLPAVRTIARRKFEEELADKGVEEFRVVGKETVRNEEGAKVEMERLTGEFEVDEFDVRLTDDESLTLVGESLSVTGWIGTWLEDGEIFAVGGVHPGENFRRSEDVSLTDAVDLTLDIDLGIWPRPYKERLFELIKHVR